jgi:hypothetical protein
LWRVLSVNTLNEGGSYNLVVVAPRLGKIGIQLIDRVPGRLLKSVEVSALARRILDSLFSVSSDQFDSRLRYGFGFGTIVVIDLRLPRTLPELRAPSCAVNAAGPPAQVLSPCRTSILTMWEGIDPRHR